uniref:Uncharacterized protein n=1 Tax=Trichogramma kaykai TaxID=54128 RepID=A0ABD2X380_9HYME
MLASPPELDIFFRTRCLVPSCECGSRFCRRWQVPNFALSATSCECDSRFRRYPCYIKSLAIKTAAALGAAATAEERKENDRNRAPRAREYISFFELCGAAYSARAIAVSSTFFPCCCILYVLGKIVVVASQRRGIFGKAMLSRHTTHDTIGIYRKAAAHAALLYL